MKNINKVEAAIDTLGKEGKKCQREMKRREGAARKWEQEERRDGGEERQTEIERETEGEISVRMPTHEREKRGRELKKLRIEAPIRNILYPTQPNTLAPISDQLRANADKLEAHTPSLA